MTKRLVRVAHFVAECFENIYDENSNQLLILIFNYRSIEKLLNKKPSLDRICVRLFMTEVSNFASLTSQISLIDQISTMLRKHAKDVGIGSSESSLS